MSEDDTMLMINRILAEVAEVTENETTNLNLTETDQRSGEEVTRVKVRWTPVHPLSLHLSTWWKESSCSAQDVLVSSLTLSLLSSSSGRGHTGLFIGNTFHILYTCNTIHDRLLLMLAVVDTVHLVTSLLSFSLPTLSTSFLATTYKYTLPYTLPIAQVFCNVIEVLNKK